MRWARVAGWVVLIVQTVGMVQILRNDSMYHGVGNDFFNQMLKDYWGSFISFDLMMGLLLFCVWLGWREKTARLLETIAWIWNILWWGNIVVAIYVLIAVHESRGDLLAFFAGRRSDRPLRQLTLHRTLAGRALSFVLAGGTAVWLWRALHIVNFTGVPAFGLYAGFLPLILAFSLMAFPQPLRADT